MRLRRKGVTSSITLAMILFALVASKSAAQQTIVVSPAGKIQTLTGAIAIARPGDRLIVKSGTYREPTIIVSKRLQIVGDGWPVLDGQNARPIMTITADSVSVRGIRFTRVGTSFVQDWAAIRVMNATGCAIENNLIDDTFFAIYLARVNHCAIRNNTIRGRRTREMASGNGIHLWQSSEIEISRNHITGHRDGIYFEFVHNSTISGNVSEKNLRYGLHFMFSDDCRYIDNVFDNNGAGVAVMFTHRVEMIGNRFVNNWGGAAYGLFLKEISDSRVERNVFARNTVALVADGANRLQAIGNDFRDNGWAVRIEASTDEAKFSGNNFSSNTFDVATNSTRQSTTFAGNYWDDYNGYDLNRDGVGDIPFHPVRLFSMVVSQNAPAIILLRSPFVRLLDTAERVIPALTPELLVDASPAMRRLRW